MQKNTQTPGTVLKDFVEKHGLNCNRLAKAVKMSNAMMRLLILDKSPISVNAAFRLAKFFKTEPKFWLELQMNYDIAKVAGDKELAKTLSEIVEVASTSLPGRVTSFPNPRRRLRRRRSRRQRNRRPNGRLPRRRPARRNPRPNRGPESGVHTRPTLVSRV